MLNGSVLTGEKYHLRVTNAEGFYIFKKKTKKKTLTISEYSFLFGLFLDITSNVSDLLLLIYPALVCIFSLFSAHLKERVIVSSGLRKATERSPADTTRAPRRPLHSASVNMCSVNLFGCHQNAPTYPEHKRKHGGQTRTKPDSRDANNRSSFFFSHYIIIYLNTSKLPNANVGLMSENVSLCPRRKLRSSCRPSTSLCLALLYFFFNVC